MAKYTIPQIAKSLTSGVVATIGAAAAAAGGADLSSLTLGQWLIAIGAGLTAFGTTFRVPNAEIPPTAETATADVERAAKSVRAVEEQRDAYAQQRDILAQTADSLKGVLVSAGTGLAADVFEQVLRGAVRLPHNPS